MNLIGICLVHSIFGTGIITATEGFRATIDFNGNIKVIALLPAITSGVITFSDENITNYLLEAADKEASLKEERKNQEKKENQRRKESLAERRALKKALGYCANTVSKAEYDAENEMLKQNHKELVANHEAGHAVLHSLVSPGSVYRVEIENNRCCGNCSYIGKLNPWINILTCLSGYAAELIKNPALRAGIGSGEDYYTAKMILLNQYKECRIVERLRCTYPPKSNGYDIQMKKDLDFFLNFAQEILKDNKDYHAALTKELMEKMSLSAADVQRIGNQFASNTEKVDEFWKLIHLYTRNPRKFEKERAAVYEEMNKTAA